MSEHSTPLPDQTDSGSSRAGEVPTVPLEPLDAGSAADATATRELLTGALVPPAEVGQTPQHRETLPAAGHTPQRPEGFTQPDPRVQPHPQVQPLPQDRAAHPQAYPQPQAQAHPPVSLYPPAPIQPAQRQQVQPQYYAHQQPFPQNPALGSPGQQVQHHSAPVGQPVPQLYAQPIQQGFPQQFQAAPLAQPYAQTPFGPPAYVQMVPQVRNSPATAALTLGIISFVLMITIIGFMFVPILSILSTIFACIGISSASKLHGLGKGKAITGLVLGLVPLGILVLVFWGSSIQ